MKVFQPEHWSYIMIEAYCGINWDYNRVKGKYVSTIPTKGENVEEWSKDRFNPENWIKEPNPDYDPNLKPNKKPKNCKGHVCADCIKCEYLAYTPIDDDLRRKLAKTIIEHEGNEVTT